MLFKKNKENNAYGFLEGISFFSSRAQNQYLLTVGIKVSLGTSYLIMANCFGFTWYYWIFGEQPTAPNIRRLLPKADIGLFSIIALSQKTADDQAVLQLWKWLVQ